MIQLYVSAKVWYSCTLTDEDEAKVRDYMQENDGEDLLDAVREMYGIDAIEIYKDSEESDFMTLEIEEATDGGW